MCSIMKAISFDENHGMLFHLGHDYRLYSKLLIQNGKLSEARDKLEKAIKIYKKCGADGWVEKYEKELATM